MRALVVAAVVMMSSAQAWAAAEPCPESPPDDPIMRRSLAKEWFAKAESSEASADRESAVRQYACSLRLVPHPATAYNLGTAAERSGDLSLASDAFRAYLKLLPDAPDRAHIEARIARLDSDVAELRRQIYLEKSGPGKSQTKSPAGAPDLAAKPPRSDVPLPEPGRSGGHRTAGWLVIGGGATALVVGGVFNFVSREKMKTCRDPALRMSTSPSAQTDLATANDACDIARPFAYGSYGLFGLAAALTATGVGILVWGGNSGDVTVAPAPLPSGSALVFSGHF